MASIPRNTAQILARSLQFVPEAYHELTPLMAGGAAVAAVADAVIAGMATASSPAAEGRDLDLYMLGFDQRRQDGETDAEFRARGLRFADRITRSAFIASIESVLDEADYHLIEGFEAYIWCDEDDDTDERTCDAYADEDTILSHERAVWVVVDGDLDTDVIDRLALELDRARICGVIPYIVWETARAASDWTPIYARASYVKPA